MHARWLLGGCVSILLCDVTPAADPADIPDVLTQDVARFRTLVTSPETQYRLEGIQGARLLRLQTFEADLLPLLDDSDAVVRQEAVQALAECGTGKSIGPLIQRLADPAWPVRQHAHLALVRMTGQAFPRAARKQWETWWTRTSLDEKHKRLFAGLKDADLERRVTAARAMRCLAAPAVEEELLQTLREGKGLGGRERKLLIETLDRIGAKKSLPFLLEQGAAGNDAAAWALGRRGGKQAEEALLKGAMRRRTLDFLLNLDRVRSTRCGPFLAALCSSFSTVIRAGRGEEIRYPPSPLRRVSANLIRRSGQAPAVVQLVLAEMEGKRNDAAVPPLKPLVESLRRILKPEFVREGFSSCDPLLGALYDLADDPGIVPRLIPLLESKCLLVRIYAGMTLGKLRASQAVEPILAVIRKGYAFSDSTAAASAKHTSFFVRMDGKPVRQSQTVRWLGYLCAALGQIGTPEARAALERLAADPVAPRDVRYGSVVGLGTIGSAESLSVLRQVAEKDVIRLIRDTAGQIVADIETARSARTRDVTNACVY